MRPECEEQEEEDEEEEERSGDEGTLDLIFLPKKMEMGEGDTFLLPSD